MIHAHQTAPTQFVEANGIRFAYRRFGKPDRVPLVFNQYSTRTMDHWDPLVTDGLAATRPGGIGEPGTSTIAPAVVNAIFALTGGRLRKLPVDASELKAV